MSGKVVCSSTEQNFGYALIFTPRALIQNAKISQKRNEISNAIKQQQERKPY